MLQLGKWNTLTIVRDSPQGLYLSSGDQDVLLPGKYVPSEYIDNEGYKPEAIGKEIDVFIYKDSGQRWIATTLKPVAKVNEIGFFEVKQITNVGAFIDWGLEKDLIIPFSEQTDELEVGDWIVAFVTIDPKTERIVASMHIDSFLAKDTGDLKEGQLVDLMIYRITELGYEVVIDQKYRGLVYQNTVFEPLDIGMESKGKIKSIRADGKIDVQWFIEKEEKQKEILTLLSENDGFMPYHDKSAPEQIQEVFGLSKKEFKRQIGHLYKEKKINIQADGIYLVK
ncbi:GntR family transcriptional regulator [Marivirga lumbricoides]|uniref:GntR family transcriptional regulator n=1 Tax=Marivirga lumbricoides TaxID=1046115 RepID=A0A2T4DQU9_9BACT|nr:GntR family transcriptional regulator [Marivirga lumbricoides]